jgi:hypothetical protein
VALGLATMAADDSTWAIELLPRALARKRAFAQRHLWMIAAGVLAVGWLGFDAWNTSQRLAVARRKAGELHGQWTRAEKAHSKTEQLIAQNEKLSAFAAQLAYNAGSGEQLARTLDLLEGHLPAEFWLTQLATDWKADPDLGVQRGAERPILRLEGRAREGTNSLSTLYQAFIRDFRAALPADAALRESLAPSGARFNIDLSVFIVPPKPAEQPAK